jgi:3' terminal RNA ribose 2'-O-methyltransferase Hen1
MLLTISTTYRPAHDLGYLLHKHPDRFQSFDLSFGKAHVYYSEVGPERCAACLLLDVDSVGIVRGKNSDQNFLLAQYVSDRPYAASSFMSVAIAQVFGSALQGRCKDRPELADTAIPLAARIDVLPVRGGEQFLRAVFEPLGYEVEAVRFPLDDRFPEWGDSPYFSVTVRKTTTLAELLTHLYVLIPVFDNRKHYWVGDDELEKLLANSEGWLAQHPEKEEITRRYLKFQPSLFRLALARLVQEEEPGEGESDEISLLFALEENSFQRKLRKLHSILSGEASAKFSMLLGTIAVFAYCIMVTSPRSTRHSSIRTAPYTSPASGHGAANS